MSKYRSFVSQGSFDPLQVPDASQKINDETQRRLGYMRDRQQVIEGNNRAVTNQMRVKLMLIAALEARN